MKHLSTKCSYRPPSSATAWRGRVVAATVLLAIGCGSSWNGSVGAVLGKDNTVKQRKVTVGSTVGSLRVIESGLQPEDQVIVSGLARAIPGEKVSPKETTITNGKS